MLGIRSGKLADLVRDALAQGGDVWVDGSGHIYVRNPTNGKHFTVSGTANDKGRVLQNTRAAGRASSP